MVYEYIVVTLAGIGTGSRTVCPDHGGAEISDDCL